MLETSHYDSNYDNPFIIINGRPLPSADYTARSGNTVGIDYLLQPVEAADWYEAEDDSLLDDPEDGKATGWLAGTTDEGSDFSAGYAAGEPEETETTDYADPKLLLPDLYSASLFAEEEESSYLPPAALLYQAHPGEYELNYVALGEYNESELPELPEPEEGPAETGRIFTPPPQEWDLEGRLVA